PAGRLRPVRPGRQEPGRGGGDPRLEGRHHLRHPGPRPAAAARPAGAARHSAVGRARRPGAHGRARPRARLGDRHAARRPPAALPAPRLLKGAPAPRLSPTRRALAALLLVLTLGAGALAWRAGPRPDSGDGEAAKAPEKAKGALDAHGDPLPPGAVGRLGTL